MSQVCLSHLSVLLQRVHDDEKSFGFVGKETLVNVAEYVVVARNYSQLEYDSALKILAKYHLAKLANRDARFRIRVWNLINGELAKKYVGRCRRCGLPISNPVSLADGHGRVCRRKLNELNKVGLK